MKHWIKIGILFFAFSVSGSAQSVTEKVSSYLAQLQQKGELSASDTSFEIISEHISSTSGIHHIYFVQTIDNLPVFGTGSAIHISGDGSMITHDHGFMANSFGRVTSARSSSLDAVQVLQKVAQQLNYDLSGEFRIRSSEKDNKETAIYINPKVSQRDIPIKLEYLLTENGDIRLVWDLFVEEVDSIDWWVIKVDASTGEILYQENLTDTCNFDVASEEKLNYNANLYDVPNYKERSANEVVNCNNCYEVIPFPNASPYNTERQISQGSYPNQASPYGWHDVNGEQGAEYLTTTGNNADVIVAGTPLYRPTTSESLDFINYSFDPIHSSVNPYKDAAATNVFYWVNKIHDILYVYGFDHRARNFQQNNYRSNTQGSGDPVVARIQDPPNICNASMSTPFDGYSPLMRLHVCQQKDGSFDNTVIIHEYIHGLLRRINASSTTGCFASVENGSEGWCDWYAVMLTIKGSDTNLTPRPIANYLFNQGPNGGGVRLYPYSTDLTVNPQTFENLGDNDESHASGAVWGVMLWEVTWALIEGFGFNPNVMNFTGDFIQDAGNIRALAIMTEALKFMPCKPNSTDMRDAILRANQSIYEGVGECYIWNAFAKRGLGVSSYAGSSDDLSDGSAAYDFPSKKANFYFPEDILCISMEESHNRSKGFPHGGIYSGPGVTDDGNGVTYSFNPVVAGLGEHTITYEVMDGFCSVASSASDTVEVIADLEAPTLTCPSEIYAATPDADIIVLDSFLHRVHAYDNCPNEVVITQDPPVGTIIQPGVNSITFTATDQAGNTSQCVVPLYLATESEILEGKLLVDMFPNPSTGELFIINRSTKQLENATIYDVRGRLVKSYDLRLVVAETELNVESLVIGVYFVTIQLDGDIVVKQLIMK